MTSHRMLVRQLRRLGLAPTAPPDPEAWAKLLDSVGRAYTDADHDRYLMERSLAISSKEMRELHDGLAQSEARQASLRRIATAVAGGVEPAGVVRLAAQETLSTLGATGLDVHWIDAQGAPTPPSGVASRVARQGAPSRLSDGAAVRIGVPCIVEGEVRAVLVASGPVLPRDTEQALTDVADLVALSIMNAEAREQLAERASTDALTGLANHGTFQERLSAEVRRAGRHGHALALVVIDIDEFKSVNDNHGHQVGDVVLAEVARRIAHTARADDLAARIGGEEFCLLLPATDGMGAYTVAERIRLLVSESPIAPIGRVTVSAGVCSLADAPDATELLRRADVALYWAKHNGRNITFRWTPENALTLARGGGETTERIRALSAVRALARAVDARDPYTLRHSDRVADLAHTLALEMGWTSGRAVRLRQAALVHDVGKIGMADEVLLKSRPLTYAEYERIKTHAALGADIVGELLEAEQVSWVRHHHERLDGSGYPDGLSGDAVPDGARILAVADTWDSLTTDRPYRAARSHTEALAECERVAGEQLCPEVVAALARLHERGTLGDLGARRMAPSAEVPWA